MHHCAVSLFWCTLIIIMVIVMLDKTTVQLDRNLVEQIKEIGKKGETYNDIIARLLNEYMEERWKRKSETAVVR